MSKIIYKHLRQIVSYMIAATISLQMTACTPKEKMYAIGVVNLAAAFDPILDGFKAGMEEAGYIEGQNVTYIYNGPAVNPDALDAIFENLKNENMDLVLTFGTLATLRTKESFVDTNIPIIFGPVTDPVASGIVTNRIKPDGNITGIQTGNPTPKRLEWLLRIDQDIKSIYVFNNPSDNCSLVTLESLQQTALIMNVDLVIADASTSDEISTALSAIPEDINAIFILPSAFFEANINQFVTVANESKLPLAAPATANVWSGVLTSYGHDNIPLGWQASGLARQILNGVNPGDLPIESAELFLAINLNTADIINLEVPYDILKVTCVTVQKQSLTL
jgi:putative ABC transport system substrate-binding protein